MTFRFLLAMLFASLPTFVYADHEDLGVLRIFAPTIGAPAENDQGGFNESYSGIKLTILEGSDFRFSVGQAAWTGQDGLQVVDTTTEQSFFTDDPSLGFPLRRNAGLETHQPGAGLLIGEVYSSPVGALDAIRVEYRLTGSEEILIGTTSDTLFVPEPNSACMLACVIPLVGLCRSRRRR